MSTTRTTPSKRLTLDPTTLTAKFVADNSNTPGGGREQYKQDHKAPRINPGEGQHRFRKLTATTTG
jgi:hypothetical protein